MVVVPGYQLYPKSAVFLPEFHGRRLQFFGYCSSFHSRKQFCGTTAEPTAFKFRNTRENPHKRFDPLRKSKRDEWSQKLFPLSHKSALSASWLDSWNAAPPMRNVDSKSQALVYYGNEGDVSSSDADEGNSSISGSTMQRIVQKLKKFGYMDDVDASDHSGITEKGLIDDIFYVEEGLLPNPRGGFSEKFPFGDESVASLGDGRVRFPWEKSEPDETKRSLDSRKTRSLAEMTLPESEITRLRNLTLKIKNKTKIKSAGVTQEIVDAIRQKWKTSEIVRLKIEGPQALNMKRMHSILERKTGGLVIWRSGTTVALYRGVTYEDAPVKLEKRLIKKSEGSHEFRSSTKETGRDSGMLSADSEELELRPVTSNQDSKSNGQTSFVRYEEEVEKLLDSLGPRYEDWPGDDPLPVDADLLPGVIPGYKPPFRLLPYGVRSTLGTKEATVLRRLARGLPPHFALGRSRQHHGLAAAMVKLWEKSSIAKIAIKRGVQLTTSERMAEDLKILTGGKLLSRNKDFLVFYRGKDFLSPDVSEALLEKERLAKALQDEEEQARLRLSAFAAPSEEENEESATAGTLKETLDADRKWGKELDDAHKEKIMREMEILRHASIIRKLENKLALAERKLRKAERVLSKVEESLNPVERAGESESLTDEERFMFRKLGLRMKAFLLLGRRGVFDGTVENMHLHWKYRELVKIIVKAPNIEEVKSIALALEAESGGVLVSVDKISKGYAIVVFRGREYKRPPYLRPKNLLTKRKALARSIELQRHQALLTHVSQLETKVRQFRSEIEQMAAVKEQGDQELYEKLETAYLSEDGDSEEEGDGNPLYQNEDLEEFSMGIENDLYPAVETQV